MDTKVTLLHEIWGLFEYLHGQLFLKFIFPLVLLRAISIGNENNIVQISYLCLLLSLSVEISIQNLNYTIPNSSFGFKTTILILYMLCQGVNGFLFWPLTNGIGNQLYFNIVLSIILVDSIILFMLYLCMCLMYFARVHTLEKDGNEDLAHIRVIKMLYGMKRYNSYYEGEK